MKQKLNWAIVGPGGIAHQFAKALQAEACNIYAVSARNKEKGEAFAAEFGIKQVYTDFDALMTDEKIDVVYIATPHSDHYGYIKKALQHGKHVFSEKAITVSTAELEEVQKLAEEKELVLAEAMTIFHMPLYEELQSRITSGKLGKLKMIQVTFGANQPNDPNNRFFSMDLAGGALLDIGTYALTFARVFLNSQPTEIATSVKKYETGVDEQSGVVLQNEAGEMAVVTMTFRASMPQQGIVAYEHGYITINHFSRADRALITYQDGTEEEITAGNRADAMRYEVRGMENFIASGTNPTASLTEDVVALMTTIREQWGIVFPFEK